MMLDTLPWMGYRVDLLRDRAWPRELVQLTEGVQTYMLPNNVVPDDIKNACIEIAAYEADKIAEAVGMSGGIMPVDQEIPVARERIEGVVEVEYAIGKIMGRNIIGDSQTYLVQNLPYVYELIKRWLQSAATGGSSAVFTKNRG
jgi:hypothetical protein